MNFLCGDESGSPSDSNVMVVCGLMVDARAFFKTADEFGRKFSKAREIKKFSNNEFKAHRFIGGKITPKMHKNFEERKNLVIDTCDRIVDNNLDIFVIGISFSELNFILKRENLSKNQVIARTLGGMFICELIRIKIQGLDDESGRTFVVLDNHPANPHMNRMLKKDCSWFDGIQQVLESKEDRNASQSTNDSERFNHIVDKTVYGVESNFSSHVQAADLVSYVYRRHFNLMDGGEHWKGEGKFIRKCIGILEPRRHKTEDAPSTGDEKCANIHEVVRHCGLTSSARK